MRVESSGVIVVELGLVMVRVAARLGDRVRVIGCCGSGWGCGCGCGVVVVMVVGGG